MQTVQAPDPNRAALPLRTVGGHRFGQFAIHVSDTGTVQRKISVGGAKVSADDLANNLVPLLTDYAKRFLQPIYEGWLKAGVNMPDPPAANYQALRTALVVELTNRWTESVKTQLPTLYSVLPSGQFNTLVYMTKMLQDFSVVPLEKAFKAAKDGNRITSKSLEGVFGANVLPAQAAGYGIFAVDWSALEPGINGVLAELQVAGSIRPAEIMKGQSIAMGQDMHLGGKTIGGQTTQDADVSYINLSGQQVLVEVAATLDRMRDKMGVNGSAQRKRYERLVQVDSKRVLAYSTPSAAWYDFFSGETGDAIAERLPVLDAAVFDDGWGLVINGHYAGPEELTEMSTKIRAAEPKVPGFWEALKASLLSYDDVLKLTADQLQKGLQKHARR